jgi:hypothetical protein
MFLELEKAVTAHIILYEAETSESHEFVTDFENMPLGAAELGEVH